MLLATAVVALLGLQAHRIGVIGTIPAGLPTPTIPHVGPGDLGELLLPAVGIAVVCYSDNVLTGRIFATRNRYSVDANQELFALGSANIAAGLVQGFAVSSSEAVR